MPIDVKSLESLELFADLGNEALARFASCMDLIKVMEGEELIRKGNLTNTLFVVLKGNFMIRFRENRAVTIHKRGETISWSERSTPSQNIVMAVALTRGEVLSFEGAYFSNIVRQDSDVGARIMKRLDKIISKRSAFFENVLKK